MKSWKAWLLVLVIFATGALSGAFGMRAYLVRNLPELLADTRQRLEEHFLEVLDRELDLTAAQEQRILPILKQAVDKAEPIHASMRAAMEEIRQQADDTIAGELDAAQRVRFAAFRKRMDEMSRQGPGGPRGPGGPPPGFPPPPGPPHPRPE